MVTRSRLDTTEYDPVCGAPVDATSARLVTVRDGVAYYFCSKDCRDEFESALAGEPRGQELEAGSRPR